MTPATPLIFNPRAGHGHGAARASRAASLLEARGIRVRLAPTLGGGGAAEMAESLARDGAPRILACGGDGTISEVADGVLRSGARPEIGFIPGGTGNSFLRMFGIERLDAAAARIADGHAREVDAARASWSGGERHFVNVLGVGFIANVAARANGPLKRLGALAYSAAVFPEVARLGAPTTRLVLDGRAMEEPLALVAVCNTIHTGGGMRIAPHAVVDDGLLDVVALRRVGRVGLLRLFPKIFDGTHIDNALVLHERARHVRIEPAEPSVLLADGETFGETPVDVHVLPRALRLLA